MRGLLVGAAAFAVLAVAVPRRAAADPVAPPAARVTYLAGGSVYVDAGHAEGLREGDTLRVVRDSRVVATMRISYLSSHRSVCDMLSTTEPIRVGDSARLAGRGSAVDSTVAIAAPRAAPSGTDSARATAPRTLAPRGVAGARLRGRFGARWVGVESGATDLSQPSGDIYLDATGLAGGHLDALVDARGRATVRRGVDGDRTSDSRQYVYRLAATLHDPAGRRLLVLGRQATPGLSGSGVLDGARAEWGRERWSLSAFSGTEPDPRYLSIGTAVAKHGAFATLRSRFASRTRWSVLAGATTSLVFGIPNRDYAFLQSTWIDERLSLFGAQELDMNRGWKRAMGEREWSLTSTLLTASLRATRALTLNAGFDNRRNVRLYRDRETPETDFDDRHREGGWLGAAANIGGHVLVTSDARAEDAGARSVSAGVELFRLAPAALTLRLRGTAYRSDETETQLWSLSTGFDPVAPAHVEVTAGARATNDRIARLESTARWEGAALDLALGRRMFATASFQRDHGESDDLRQVFSGLTWRF